MGIANPLDRPINVNVIVTTQTSTPLASFFVPVPAHQTAQFDIFTAAGIAPQANVQVSMGSTDTGVFYGYASVVRNDTGDAIFLFGTSPNS